MSRHDNGALSDLDRERVPKPAEEAREPGAPEDPLGACRFDDGSGNIVCREMRRSECRERQGAFEVDGRCP